MAGKLQHEIGKRRPFECAEEEAFLSILRTADMMDRAVVEMFKPYDLSPTQYNVLRILRGAEPEGLCRNEVRDRMISRMPDVTRLLDRMEASGLVERTRSATDRRVVATQLTSAGRKLVDDITDAMNDLHRRQLGHLSQKQLATLIDLLTQARQKH